MYPTIYEVLYIPGGFLAGSLNHQKYRVTIFDQIFQFSLALSPLTLPSLGTQSPAACLEAVSLDEIRGGKNGESTKHIWHEKWKLLELQGQPVFYLTPLKTNMEPENHPFEKEKHLPSLFHVKFRGSILSFNWMMIPNHYIKNGFRNHHFHPSIKKGGCFFWKPGWYCFVGSEILQVVATVDIW